MLQAAALVALAHAARVHVVAALATAVAMPVAANQVHVVVHHHVEHGKLFHVQSWFLRLSLKREL